MSNAPHKRRVFTDKEVRQMQKLHEMGWTNHKIAYTYKVPQIEVDSFFKELRIKQRNSNIEKRLKKKLTKEQQIRIEKGFLDGEGVKQISEATGLSEHIIRNYLGNVKIHLVTNSRVNQNNKHGVNYRKKTRRDQLIKIPCPIWECSAFKHCEDKENPERCIVWRNYFYSNKDISG